MGRWRLTPPWYWGDTACGRETIPVGDKYYACAAARRHLIRPLRGHLPLKGKALGGAIQYRGPLKGEGFGRYAARGEGLTLWRDEELYAAARLHLIRPLRGHLPLKGKANGGTPFNAADLQVDGLGDKKKRPGALLLALFISFCLFISFWWCRSGPSGTGVTGRRRGLRRGRRSWENPWHRRP